MSVLRAINDETEGKSARDELMASFRGISILYSVVGRFKKACSIVKSSRIEVDKSSQDIIRTLGARIRSICSV